MQKLCIQVQNNAFKSQRTAQMQTLTSDYFKNLKNIYKEVIDVSSSTICREKG